MTVEMAAEHLGTGITAPTRKAQPSPRAVQASAPTERPMDEDDLLLRRIAEHDEAAFRSLVERHVDRTFALALRILNNEADADDVVQDVLLKVWTTRGTWQEGRARFSTWLYRVVTNRCLDLRRRPRTEDIDTAPDVEDDRPDAVTTIHQGEVGLLLEKAMSRLPDHQRIAVILAYHDNLSNPEIAEILSTTVSAVESLLKRGRQHLRHNLRNAEVDILDSFTKG